MILCAHDSWILRLLYGVDVPSRNLSVSLLLRSQGCQVLDVNHFLVKLLRHDALQFYGIVVSLLPKDSL